jgi:hypothetical protein
MFDEQPPPTPPFPPPSTHAKSRDPGRAREGRPLARCGSGFEPGPCAQSWALRKSRQDQRAFSTTPRTRLWNCFCSIQLWLVSTAIPSPIVSTKLIDNPSIPLWLGVHGPNLMYSILLWRHLRSLPR